MANQTTMLADLINPEVMADMISAKVEEKIVVAPFAKVDNTLVGQAGNTITVPQYKYIGDAEDIAEGVACETVKLQTSTTQATVKKAMKAVEITDEAILSGYGDPVGQANDQLAKAIASKLDNDALEAITTKYNESTAPNGVQLLHDGIANKINYSGIVDAIDKFGEEVQSEKVMFVNPAQVTTLRKDTDFISADKYDNNVMMNGEIGKIAGTRIVPSKKVVLVPAKDSVAAHYDCPIVKLNNDNETEEDAPAITIYLKRDTNVEKERNTLARKTDVSVDKHYVAVLSNQSKVVLATFKA